MKLLIITQKVDRNDPVLGFFHRWIEEFAKNFEKVTVIALGVGDYDLPQNVKVLSLGKETSKSKFKYLINFYKYVWQERRNYDAVFVHMNQEYVLLAGDMWRLMGKKVYLWRNHAKGNFLTRLAVLLVHQVFYTSPQSFIARFKKAVQMPVGIDTEFFKPDPNTVKVPNSVLFIGRISPVKKVGEFIEWLKSTDYNATIAGPIGDKEYAERILDNLPPQVKYIGPVTQEEALKLYQTHELYVNLTPSGSLDKTILEAAACGTRVMVENEYLKSLKQMSQNELRDFVTSNHSLELLLNRLLAEMS